MLDVNEIVNRLNHIANLTDKLKEDLLNETIYKNTHKQAKKKNKAVDKSANELEKMLCKHNLPIDKDFVEDIDKILRLNRINLEQANSCFERINKANVNNSIKDIKKYTFSCLHKINKKD